MFDVAISRAELENAPVYPVHFGIIIMYAVPGTGPELAGTRADGLTV